MSHHWQYFGVYIAGRYLWPVDINVIQKTTINRLQVLSSVESMMLIYNFDTVGTMRSAASRWSTGLR
jgi:hypothetical protein